jgi:hypothetical protein
MNTYKLEHGFNYEMPTERGDHCERRCEALEREGWEIVAVTVHPSRQPQGALFVSWTWVIVARRPVEKVPEDAAETR